ncbi:hypothetical protein GcM1_227067 [Golovinomyces cichoracearum]|uniref:Uncharacterized protein n=1 Tax=Golovinomyces cichoracearum TaxID=62708 RepID=A0A420IPI8_9PEZI|nr:hypothetical protein GcM1_227067 [Golovinomyces cichoracearum]
MVVNGVIKAFIRGIKDENIKKTILMRAEKLSSSLFETCEITQQTMRRLEQSKEFENREYEKMGVEFLRKDFANRHGRPLVAVLADMGSGSREVKSNLQSFEQYKTTAQRPQISYTQPTMRPESRNERNPEF